jgi:hypothetical protein
MNGNGRGTPRIQTFALIAGVIYALVALLGVLPMTLHAPPADAPHLRVETGYGYITGLFPVNVLHTAVHLLIGVWGLIASRGFSASVLYARVLAVVYGLLAVMGAIPALGTVFGLIPIFGHDVWLHALTAIVAAFFGFGSPSRRP